jgi:hypothetical protein
VTVAVSLPVSNHLDDDVRDGLGAQAKTRDLEAF